MHKLINHILYYAFKFLAYLSLSLTTEFLGIRIFAAIRNLTVFNFYGFSYFCPTKASFFSACFFSHFYQQSYNLISSNPKNPIRLLWNNHNLNADFQCDLKQKRHCGRDKIRGVTLMAAFVSHRHITTDTLYQILSTICMTINTIAFIEPQSELFSAFPT